MFLFIFSCKLQLQELDFSSNLPINSERLNNKKKNYVSNAFLRQTNLEFNFIPEQKIESFGTCHLKIAAPDVLRLLRRKTARNNNT